MSMAILGLLFIGMVILFIETADHLEEKRKERFKLYKTNLLLSMVRRMMPTIIAHDIIGVQPMTAPTGSVFSLRYVYNEPHQFAFPFPYPEPVVEHVPQQLDLFEPAWVLNH